MDNQEPIKTLRALQKWAQALHWKLRTDRTYRDNTTWYNEDNQEYCFRLIAYSSDDAEQTPGYYLELGGGRIEEQTVSITSQVYSKIVAATGHNSFGDDRYNNRYEGNAFDLELFDKLCKKEPVRKHNQKTYFIGSEALGFVKIGVALDVEKRLKQLQTGHPHKLSVLLVLDENIESALHEHFSEFRAEGEWFHYADPLKDYIRSHLRPVIRIPSRLNG